MILQTRLIDNRYKKGYRQIHKEFADISELNNWLNVNRKMIYGNIKRYSIYDKGKITIGVMKNG